MTPEMLEALKAYLKENLSVSVFTDSHFGNFGGSNNYQVKVRIFLDGEEIAEDYDTFTVESN